jgi:hypothetical protein
VEDLPPPVRDGARRAAIYNDGLVVYLYDEMFQAELLSADAWERLSQGLSTEKPDRSLKAFLSSRKVVAYELYQDDSVVVDVCVGAPLTKDELKSRRGMKWHKAVTTLIDLPSGKLRIESGNSCRIGGENPADEGATLEVPPGEYLLTLHRADWAEMVNEEPRVAGETITLTPIDEATAPKKFSAALPYPQKTPKHSWIGKFRLDGERFDAQACFLDPWDFIDLNLDRAACEKLALGPGSVVDVTIAGRNFAFVLLSDALQLTIGGHANYKQLFGNDRTTAEIAREPEVVLALLNKPGDLDFEILRGMRVKTTEGIDTPRKWQKASGVVRPARLPLVDLDDLGKWKKDEDGVGATALVVTGNVVSASLAPEALDALGLQPGDKFVIESGGVRRTALYVASPKEALSAMQRTEPVGPRRDEYMALRTKMYDLAGDALEAVRDQIRAILIADPPLVGFFDKHWLDPTRSVFCLMPMSMSKESIGVVFSVDLPCRPGGELRFRKP